MNEGYELEQQGRLAEGIEKYKSALRLGPNPKLTERIAILERKIAEQRISPRGGQTPVASEQQIFSNNNTDSVRDNPSADTTFRADRPCLVTYVMTYHYNGGKGKAPGKILLRHEDGTMYGPWRTSGMSNQGSQANQYWECRPNVMIKPGIYTVIDTDLESWSWNPKSGGGITVIKGVLQGTSQSPAKAPSSGQAGDARSVKAAAREDSGSKVGGQVKPVIATPPQAPQSPSTLPNEGSPPPVGRSESGVIDSSSGDLEGTWAVPTDAQSLKREIYFSRNGKSYTGKIVIEEGFDVNSFQIGEVAVRVTRVGANVYKGEYLSILDGIRTWRSHTFAVKDDVFYVTDLVGQEDMDPTICRRKKSEAIPEAISEVTTPPAKGDDWVVAKPSAQAKGSAASAAKVPVSVQASPAAAVEEQIFSNNNIDGVGDGPIAATTFRTDRPWLVTYVLTYHYNGGRGKTPGAIGLKNEDGTMYGPWQTSGSPNQGSQTNLYWECRPNVVIKSGVYTVIDSDPVSWSWNSQSGGGITIIKGRVPAEASHTIQIKKPSKPTESAGNKGGEQTSDVTQAPQAETVWLLKTTAPEIDKNDDRPELLSTSGGHPGTSATSSVSFAEGFAETSHSWSATPAGRLTPGQKLQVTVSVSGKGPGC